MLTILDNYNLLQHNSFHLPGTCRRWIEATDAGDMPQLAEILEGDNFFIIGAGCNVVLTCDYAHSVVKCNMLEIEVEIDRGGDMLIHAGAGIMLDDIVSQCCATGRYGMENLSGIPSSVGASVVQNVGAYGSEVKDVVDTVHCYDLVGRRFKHLSADECQFGYRDSLFKQEKGRYIVTSVTYRLRKNAESVLTYEPLRKYLDDEENPSPMVIREAVLDIRNSKLPAIEEYGSAGSFFKNPVVTCQEYERLMKCHTEITGQEEPNIPHYITDEGVKIPAAWLIDQCGFKGYRVGNVGVWDKQPLVIINATGHATGVEVMALADKITRTVEDRYGIILQPEVELI